MKSILAILLLGVLVAMVTSDPPQCPVTSMAGHKCVGDPSHVPECVDKIASLKECKCKKGTGCVNLGWGGNCEFRCKKPNDKPSDNHADMSLFAGLVEEELAKKKVKEEVGSTPPSVVGA